MTDPVVDPAQPLQFVVNSASGSSDADTKRDVVDAGLRAAGRQGEIHLVTPTTLVGIARAAAGRARELGSAVVAVGGDGTLNAVAQAAHAAGCPMGVVARGTFNLFARSHGLPTEPEEAVAAALAGVPVPVQVAAVNQRLFLVNASLGLYPDLLEDREAFKSRFGRSRSNALWAACLTLLRAPRQMHLRIERDGALRVVRTLTLFVGNNRLQMQQVGLDGHAGPPAGHGAITAAMLRPVGTFGLFRLLLRGAAGTLGDADEVESFAFDRLVVAPARTARRTLKVAFDGEVAPMRAPLEFRVLERPLYLLKPPPRGGTAPGSDG